MKSKTEAGYREEVEKILLSRRDATRPDEGYPFPWPDDPKLTDIVYSFADGNVTTDCEKWTGWPDLGEANVKYGIGGGCFVAAGS